MSVEYYFSGFVEYQGQELEEKVKGNGKYIPDFQVRNCPRIGSASINNLSLILFRHRDYVQSFNEISEGYDIDFSCFRNAVEETWVEEVCKPEYLFAAAVKLQRCIHQKWQEFSKPHIYKVVCMEPYIKSTWSQCKGIINGNYLRANIPEHYFEEERYRIEFDFTMHRKASIHFQKMDSNEVFFNLTNDDAKIWQKFQFLTLEEITRPDLSKVLPSKNSTIKIWERPIWTEFEDEFNSIYRICNLAMKHNMGLRLVAGA